MDRVCPLCNGLRQRRAVCTCGARMEDAGPVADYYGSYSPYFNLSFEDSVCRHLFRCPACGREECVTVSLEAP